MKLVYFLAGVEILTGAMLGAILLAVWLLGDPSPWWLLILVTFAYCLGFLELWCHAWEMVRRERGQ